MDLSQAAPHFVPAVLIGGALVAESVANRIVEPVSPMVVCTASHLKGMRQMHLGLKRTIGALFGLCALSMVLTPILSGCGGSECARLLGRSDECNATDIQCVDATHISSCVADHCDATWGAPRACPSSKPYCVQTSTAVLRAECATTPSCSATTEACGGAGLCGDGAGKCVLTAAGCAATCGYDGRCGFDGSACITTAEGCAASIQCKTNGTCREVSGYCAASLESCAASTSACGNNGLCGYADGRCAPTEAGCAASAECASGGACAAGSDRCIATQAGCAASRACLQSNHCQLKDGICS